MWRTQESQQQGQQASTSGSREGSAPLSRRPTRSGSGGAPKNFLKKLFPGQWKGRSQAGEDVRRLHELPPHIREEVRRLRLPSFKVLRAVRRQHGCGSCFGQGAAQAVYIERRAHACSRAAAVPRCTAAPCFTFFARDSLLVLAVSPEHRFVRPASFCAPSFCVTCSRCLPLGRAPLGPDLPVVYRTHYIDHVMHLYSKHQPACCLWCPAALFDGSRSYREARRGALPPLSSLSRPQLLIGLSQSDGCAVTPVGMGCAQCVVDPLTGHRPLLLEFHLNKHRHARVHFMHTLSSACTPCADPVARIAAALLQLTESHS